MTIPRAAVAKQVVKNQTTMGETGMLHQLRQAAPDIDFQAVNDHAECKYMKMITPAALERCLVEETDEVTVPEDIANAARKSLEAMISIGNPGGGE